MELRPALRRLYMVLRNPAPYLPVMVELGFVPFEAVDVGGTTFQPVWLDFGPGSVDGWLAGLAARELGVDDTRLLDPEARELVIDGRRVPLTRIELALAELLLARTGAVASRHEILRTVWQTDHEGSNVIEAAIGSLRANSDRKLTGSRPCAAWVTGFELDEPGRRDDLVTRIARDRRAQPSARRPLRRHATVASR